jgi:hypothetical protein
VSTPELYEQRAADCVELAKTTDDPTTKALLVEMAQTWMKLAQRARGQLQDGDTEK